jgi:hypothetical protein
VPVEMESAAAAAVTLVSCTRFLAAKKAATLAVVAVRGGQT